MLEVQECILGKPVELRSCLANADCDPSTLNLVTVMCTPKEQPFYIGMTGLSYGSGCILGPIVGGSLADSSATWRWVSGSPLE